MNKKRFSLVLATLALGSIALAAKNEDFKKVVAAAKNSPLETPARITAAAAPAEPAPVESEEELPPAKPASTVTSKPAPGSKDVDHDSQSDDHSAQDDGMSISTKPAEPAAGAAKKAEESHTSPSHAAPSHSAAPGVPPEQSLKWLTNGNTRYVTKRFRADGRFQTDRDRTKVGQHPHAIVLSCADSRVPPELVFDQGLGEIFTIRVAGEALDSSVIASIEYAVEHLGPKLIVVLGHTKCGAVDTAMKVPAGQSAGSESIDKLLNEIRPHLKTRTTQKPSKDLEVESALNADGVARDLLQRSEIVRSKVESGELQIKSALYWLDSGRVKFY
ncbi:MAG: carbonic anhydrase [Bdellovibrionota bacterium]